MSIVNALKKPLNPFILWRRANREKISNLAGSKDVKTVCDKTSELWKVVSAAEKAQFEKEAQRQQTEYNAYIATDVGQQALAERSARKKIEKQAKQDLIAQKTQKNKTKTMRERKRKRKAVVKDEKLKALTPGTAYCMWRSQNRERISASVGGRANASRLASKAGELWRELSETEKAPYEARVSKAKADYDTYIATSEGAAALEAYKAAVAMAYKEKVVEKRKSALKKRKSALKKRKPALKKRRSAAVGGAG